MQRKITAFLTFDGQAEEAVAFDTSVFEGSRIRSTTRQAMLQMGKIEIAACGGTTWGSRPVAGGSVLPAR
jgi:predicted 3-demethylubiquinone-9 3-methyltransferase (glyoxalase superfamily)